MGLSIPKPNVSKEQLKLFLTDPEIVILELLFLILTLSNVFVLYRILLNICPFPIIVTWFQLLTGFIFAYVLGEVGKEFPKFAYFPPLTIDMRLYEGLAMPTLVYLGMITMANVLLHKIPSIAMFPVVVSFAVMLHHVSRFIGCGQIYLPIRWISLAIMVSGFFLSVFDSSTIGYRVFPLAIIYGVFSAIFRAWCLEKAMHVCNGQGNVLHNHKVVLGICLLPFVSLLFNETGFFHWMPTNILLANTWQVWGCLVTAGTLPFVKNVVANRMIRHTGQAPWRVLEIISMILLFIFGGIFYDNISVVGVVAFILVVSGRVLGMLDALSKDSIDRRRPARVETEPQHAAVAPQYNYDPTGIADSFDHEGVNDIADSSAAHDTCTPFKTHYQSLKAAGHPTIPHTTGHTNPLLSS